MQILNQIQIDQKLNRIALQIWEENAHEKQILLVGVQGNGFVLAKELTAKINQLTLIKADCLEIEVNKSNPFEGLIKLNGTYGETKNGVLILVDDVLNTGKTLMAAIQFFLPKACKRIQVMVLVNRNHKNFPVQADYIGMNLSTTLQEHVEVISIDGNLSEVVLK